ncbi:MAG TPA: thioredoxin-dependent thiol peroxidase, partial [Tepidisphaeraceae bacterium]|nr:thioredoxin-dependent thiol peroxidase [Tepidisphaeraceae bacterium]
MTKKTIRKTGKKALTAKSKLSTVPSTALKPGSKLPKFALPASDGTTVSSEQLSKGIVVLYFYPKADTPGCTVEACGFSDAIARYRKLGVPVFGVSPDPIKPVEKFAAKFKLKFPLLADEDHSVCEQFGVWVEKRMYGRKYMGAARTTFIVRDGQIAHVFEQVKPDAHEGEVLEWLKANR